LLDPWFLAGFPATPASVPYESTLEKKPGSGDRHPARKDA
jgi:hypothetical protein